MKILKFKRSFSGPCAPTRHSWRRVLSRWWDEPCAIFSSGRGCPVKKWKASYIMVDIRQTI